MNCAVPMNRAKASDQRPKVSWSSCGVGRTWRRASSGVSRPGRPRSVLDAAASRARRSAARRRSSARASSTISGPHGAHSRAAAPGRVVVLRLPPVLGEQVVEHVVHGDHADQAPCGVGHRQRHEVVRRQLARGLPPGWPPATEVRAPCRAPRRRLVRGLPQHPLDVGQAQVAARGGLQRRPADVHRGRQRGGEVGPADVRECLGDRVLRRHDRPARRSSGRPRCAPRTPAAAGRPRPRRGPSAPAVAPPGRWAAR